MTNLTSLRPEAIALDARVRKNAPLIHHMTNQVVMNFTANVTLALGAQPVMAHAPEELEQMVGLASVLVLNIGTLDAALIEAMRVAGKAATKRGIPIVLDPVGAGATTLRTQTARLLLDELDVWAVRANAGEVMALAGEAGATRGVDSLAGVEAARDSAAALAQSRALVVAMTGPVDLVTDGQCWCEVNNGHALMSRVTGTGCAATTAVACALAVTARTDACVATACALAVFGHAGEVAARTANGPGSFVPAFVDALAQPASDSSELRVARVI